MASKQRKDFNSNPILVHDKSYVTLVFKTKPQEWNFPKADTPKSVCLIGGANEMVFFIAEFEREAKIRKIAVYRFL